MKKIMRLPLVMWVLMCLVLTACASKTTDIKSTTQKRIIYATFFPVADLTKRIVGDKMDVELIIKRSQEPHSFELQIQDLTRIADADLIIYNGANMENFIPDLEKVVKNKEKFLDLSQGLVLLEGSHEHHDEDEHEENHEEHEHEHHGVNPHTWLSIKNAMIELDTIYQKISSIDPDNDSYYRQNLDIALKEFRSLDQKFSEELSKVEEGKRHFVVSHAAFNYLAEDYGLRQVAVTGISPEEEPSAKQLKDIADFVEKHEITTIFFEGKATPKVAETLARTTNVKTATLFTMESLTEQEAAMGYLKLMELNLEALVDSFHD